ncbi:hypothetical protein GCM10023353_03940 [Tomitella cavernea]|uniref:Uncharacterized protein n=1 Tax=Tomitella cavernea TaxID=1387982 RepID=A0ABP9C3Q6_9ACTN
MATQHDHDARLHAGAYGQRGREAQASDLRSRSRTPRQLGGRLRRVATDAAGRTVNHEAHSRWIYVLPKGEFA